MPTTIVWLHKDLRVHDNEALTAACNRGAVVALYVWSPEEMGDRAPGAAFRWWLHHALVSVRADLETCGVPLVLRRAPRAAPVVEELLTATQADAVFWNKRYDPAVQERDTRLAVELRRRGIWVEEFPGWLLHEPNSLRTASGEPYRVFTPFWRRLSAIVPPTPRPRPRAAAQPRHVPASDDVFSWGLLPEIPWDRGFYAAWQPTEHGAAQALEEFVRSRLTSYRRDRDNLGCDGTSRLSPYLAHGQLSPRQVWHRVRDAKCDPAVQQSFLRQLAWREFAYHLLDAEPCMHAKALRPEFEGFPWKELQRDTLRRWQRGHTGIPVIDAGMRQLWTTGWMHNRARMIVASWLTKNLLGHWRHGERWFWDTLVDADAANNPFGWQWVAGCGADAAPYWRVFQPLRQGVKFDGDGSYVRQWVPELSQLPNEFIHCPWRAPKAILDRAGVALGRTYPLPMVDPEESRQGALAAFASWRKRVAS